MERAEYADWFSANIYPLARSFAGKNPVAEVEFDDYVQDLVTAAWCAMDRYDPSAAALSTFVTQWFKSAKFMLTDKIRTRHGYATAIDSVDADGESCNAADLSESDDDPEGEYEGEELYSMLSPMSALRFAGWARSEVAALYGVSERAVTRAVNDDLKAIKSAMGMGGEEDA